MRRTGMEIIVNDSVYMMEKEQADGVLKVASEQIPFGVYAVEKDGIIELRKDKCNSKTQLKRLVQQFKSKGFKVYFNENSNDSSRAGQKKD